MMAWWWRLVRFGFRLLYYELAFTYDWVANLVSLGDWWAWQRSALGYLPRPEQGIILELAFGTGHMQEELHKGGWQTVGCDLSPHMAYIARRRLSKRNIPAKLTQGRAQALPYQKNQFSAVLSTFPTPFILEDATLDEIKRVLKPDGVLVFVPSGVLTKGGTAKAALEGAYQVTGQRSGWGVELDALFAARGFRLEKVYVEHPRSIATVMIAYSAVSGG